MKRAGRPRKSNINAKLKAWHATPRFRAMLCEAGRRGIATAWAKPRCGAKTRSGELCRGLAMKNGRCRMHGGMTTAGDRWHRPRMPKKNEKNGVERFDAKISREEKRRAFRFQRLAMMTPERRERFLKWEKSHPPGPQGPRAAATAKREQADWFGAIVRKVDAERAASSALKAADEEHATAKTEGDVFA